MFVTIYYVFLVISVFSGVALHLKLCNHIKTLNIWITNKNLLAELVQKI